MDYFNLNGIGTGGTIGIILLLVWSLFWKGLALWHAARLGNNRWFIAMLLLNTMGILEIFYLFKVVKLRFNKLW
jgi:hypothetical protein